MSQLTQTQRRVRREAFRRFLDEMDKLPWWVRHFMRFPWTLSDRFEEVVESICTADLERVTTERDNAQSVAGAQTVALDRAMLEIDKLRAEAKKLDPLLVAAFAWDKASFVGSDGRSQGETFLSRQRSRCRGPMLFTVEGRSTTRSRCFMKRSVTSGRVRSDGT